MRDAHGDTLEYRLAGGAPDAVNDEVRAGAVHCVRQMERENESIAAVQLT
jgi:hypothetical protein